MRWFFTIWFALGACHAAAPAPSIARPVAPPAGRATAATDVSADLSLLPIDSDLVLGVDWTKLQHSAFYGRYIAPRIEAWIGRWIAEVRSCGLEPLAATALTIGIKLGSSAGDSRWVVVAHGLDRAKAAACFEPRADTGHVFFDETGHFAMMFADAHTVVAVIGPHAASAAEVKALVRGDSGLDRSPAFAGVATADAVWVAANGTTTAIGRALQGVRLDSLSASLKVSDAITVDGRVHMRSSEDADQAATMFKADLLPKLAPLVDRFDVGGTGAVITMQIEAGRDTVDRLVHQMAPEILAP
jgi:hypothetical protein